MSNRGPAFSTFRLNLQSLSAFVRLWSGFSGAQWLCCSFFALITIYDRTVSFFQNEFTPSQWKDTGVERNVKVGGTTNSKILSIFDHVVRNSSTIESNYQ
jgi:hypothetical protein